MIACPCAFGDLDAGHGGERFGRCCPARHFDQRRRSFGNARHIKAIALDKTGTITEGKPKLVAREVIASEISRRSSLALGRDLAAHSDHPVAQAIATGLVDSRCKAGCSRLQGATLTAASAPGMASNWCWPAIARRSSADDGLDIDPTGATRSAGPHRHAAGVHHPGAGTCLPSLTASNSPQKRRLRNSATGVASIMLTGDNQATASAIAQAAGIDDARGSKLPEEKWPPLRQCKRIWLCGDDGGRYQ